jgi:hypothetical protein
MTRPPDIDGVLIEWGDRLFYPGNRSVRFNERLKNMSRKDHAASIRARIAATVVRHAPQVMVKVTGGGRGMKAIAAHLRYISKHGRLQVEDERGQSVVGKDAVREIADDWRYGGSLIGEESHRREAFNIILSMPAGTHADVVQKAAREFAQTELTDHKYVMVLHDHQANPHVHLSVRAESIHGVRLNPRKADLQRWRETFAEKLRGWGVDAEATRQATRGATRQYPDLWRVKAAAEGRLRKPRGSHRRGEAVDLSRHEARHAWDQIATALAKSGDTADRELAAEIDRYTRGTARGLDRAAVKPPTVNRPSVVRGR